MNMKKTKWTAFLLSALLVLTFTACGSADSSASESPFAQMETVDLDGNAVDSSVYADRKLTFINTWNIGCTPCIVELPELDQLNKAYAEKGVAVQGLYYNFGEELSEEVRSEIDSILANAKAEYPQLLISEAMMESAVLQELAAFPTTYIVDSQGNLVDTVVGSRSFEDWAAIADELLEKVAENG